MEDLDPLHSERHRTTFLSSFLGYIGWIMVIVAIPVGFLGSGTWVDTVALLGLGSILGGSHWFIAPRRYNVFERALTISYGRPREKVVPFNDIAELEVKKHPLGTDIRVRLHVGRTLSLQPWHPREFYKSLENALKRHRGMGTGGHPTEYPTG